MAAQSLTSNIVIVDDKDAQKTGDWTESSWSRDRYGDAYLHDNKTGKGGKTITWTPTIREAGEYEVRLSYNANGGRAKNTPVTVRHTRGEFNVALDQTQPPKFGNLFQPIGRFHFDAGKTGTVTLSNAGTIGHVIADAVAFVPVALADKEASELPQPGRHVILKPERVREFSGVYPHLASFNEHGECGTGAVVPWADRLWFITYAPHEPKGSTDRLYEIAPDLTMTIRGESVGGTPANRMIHRESNQLFIGPYVIDAARNVRVISPSSMLGRLTGNARHLTDPANKIYYATMEEGLYEVNVRSLAVKELYRDGNFPNANYRDILPGYHGKGLYSGQGKLIYANNGENSPLARQRPDIASGVLAQWDGAAWEVVQRNQFTEVTGPGGIYGNAHPESDPVWSVGWDHRSLMLMMLDGGEWRRFRLPKASHSYDGAHGWNTEWPRIRDIGEGDDLLMTMHGMFWRFPKTFSAKNTAGIRPRSSYLKVIGDFARWGDKVVFGCDDAAKNEFLNTRKAKGKVAGPAKSQSNLWFVQPDDIDRLGPPIGGGGVWVNEKVKAGEWSDPFLIDGFDHCTVHLVHDAGKDVTFQFSVDRDGAGNWTPMLAAAVGAEGYRWLDLESAGTAVWVRVKTDADCAATVWFELRNADKRQANQRFKWNTTTSRPNDNAIVGGLLRAGNRAQGLQVLATFIRDTKGTVAGYYELSPDLELIRKESPESEAWMTKNVALPQNTVEFDAASAIYIDDDGARWRLPIGNAAFRENPRLANLQRTSREATTERDLFQCAGTFFELPARNAGGFAKIRPIATHAYFIQDYCSWRGLLALTGFNPVTSQGSNRFVVSADREAAVWLGSIDDLWELGKPTGKGGPWKNTQVKAGEWSDPYLLTGYDQRSLTLSHEADETVAMELQVDLTGAGLWRTFKKFEAPPRQTTRFRFPEAFQAYWARLRAGRDCMATAHFDYR